MADFCGELTFPALGFRLGWCSVPALASEAVLALDADPVAAHLLGRSLAAFLASGLLASGRCQVQWHYQGKLAKISLAADRGTLMAAIDPPHLAEQVSSLEELFGDVGTLTLAINGRGHRGEIPLLDPPRDLAYFESLVRQTECGVAAAIAFRPDPASPVDACRAVWLQALPDTDLAVFDGFRQRLESPEFAPFLLELPDDADLGAPCARFLAGADLPVAESTNTQVPRLVRP